MSSYRRVAFFADTFLEANGVGTLAQQLVKFAKSRDISLLAVVGGDQTSFEQDGSVSILSLRRSLASFPLDKNLKFDPLLTRYGKLVTQHLLDFKPDLVNITGPGDLGWLGLWVSHQIHVPLVASWHTNFHEYVARRLDRILPTRLTAFVQQETLRGLLRFYRTARFTLAPNQPMVDLLNQRVCRPAFLMQHGVDLDRFTPPLQPKDAGSPFCIGYVGRLTSEKNVRAFADIEEQLKAAGESNYHFLLVGEGGQQHWLRANMQRAELPGVLRGEALADAYRRMDVFVFPSRTDTFGLVVLEAMACGVPVIVSPETGRGVGITDAESGLITDDFPSTVLRVKKDSAFRANLSAGGRCLTKQHGWDRAFEALYRTYAYGLSATAASAADLSTAGT